MMRLSTCMRCGEDTVSRETMIKGRIVWEQYDEDNHERLHRYSCKKSAWRGVQLERRAV